MARFSTLFLAVALASPALYSAFVKHTLDPMTALLRLLIAVPVAAIMLAVVRTVTHDYGRERKPAAEPTTAPPIRAEAVTGEPVGQQRRSTDVEPTP
jgi:hypothetical protein